MLKSSAPTKNLSVSPSGKSTQCAVALYLLEAVLLEILPCGIELIIDFAN